MIIGQVADACPECGKDRLAIRCASCKGKDAKGVLSKRDCKVCSGTGTVIICSNKGCRRFDKRIAAERRPLRGAPRQVHDFDGRHE
jgi:hypothetical protein